MIICMISMISAHNRAFAAFGDHVAVWRFLIYINMSPSMQLGLNHPHMTPAARNAGARASD